MKTSAPQSLDGGGFAADAKVSFDGKRVLFAGKQTAGDSRQIFELTLEDRSVRRLISGEGDLKVAPAQVRLESMDSDGHAVTMGTAAADADGSFFVRTPADKPIRFALLDAKGVVVREEHGWFWIRRGEQRYCVGCHAGPERSSENRVPAVLLRTTTPVDLTGAKPAAETPTGTRGGN